MLVYRDSLRNEIKTLLLLQFRLMMDTFFRTGEKFELTNNGAFIAEDMTVISDCICEEYGLRLIVASANDENQFAIDGECIGTLGECFSKRGISTRFSVGVNNRDAEHYCCIDNSAEFASISISVPAYVTNSALTAVRDELRDMVIMQRLRQPN
jgi:hypothetical protein